MFHNLFARLKEAAELGLPVYLTRPEAAKAAAAIARLEALAAEARGTPADPPRPGRPGSPRDLGKFRECA